MIAPIIKGEIFIAINHHKKVLHYIFECNICHIEFTRKASYFRKSQKQTKNSCCFHNIQCKSKWIVTLNNFAKKGNNHNSWNGGKRKNPQGYIMIYSPNHPAAIRNYVAEHRLIMEKQIGRLLTPNDIVHHINENKTDNNIENLELMTRSEHSRQHRLKEYRNHPGVRGFIRKKIF